MTELMENIWIEWVESQAISNQMAIEVRLRPSPEKKKAKVNMTRWQMEWAWISLAQPRYGRRSSLDGMMRGGGANTQAYGGGTLA